MKNFFELFSYTAFNFYYFPKKDGSSYERAIKGTIFMFAFFVLLLMIPFYVFSPLRDVINVKKYDLPPLGKVTLRYFLNGIWLLLVFLPVYYKCYKRGWRVLRIYAKYRHKDLGMYSWKWFFGAASLAFIPLYLGTLYFLGKLIRG